jgi:membrane associated rhomboid family serine protease
MGSSVLRRPFSYTFFNAAFGIICVNVAVYVVLYFLPQLQRYLALNPRYFVRGHMYWQVVTYMFVHSGMSHLLFNMLGIFFFGVTVERALGSREFLLFYLLSGVLCGAASVVLYVFAVGYSVFLVGASGAIYALLFAYAVINPRAKVFIWGILPVPAPLLVLLYAALALFSQVSGRGGSIAHLTHFAGFLAAWVYMRVRMGVKPLKIWRDAWR